MKSVLIGLMLTIGLSASANTTESVYKKDSILPAALKEQIIQYISKQCPQDISAYGLNEIQTVVTYQSEPDVESRTEFETVLTSRYYFDGMHPVTQEIRVNTSESRTHTGQKYFDVNYMLTQTGCQ